MAVRGDDGGRMASAIAVPIRPTSTDRKSGSHVTPRWREADSNPRSPVKRDNAFRDCPRQTTPSRSARETDASNISNQPSRARQREALKLYELRPPKSFRVRIYTNAILLSVALRSRNYMSAVVYLSQAAYSLR